jgi:hypothetical protein
MMDFNRVLLSQLNEEANVYFFLFYDNFFRKMD